MAEKKLIVVIGATGNQGGSVARRFLQDPKFAVRALTRNPESAASQELRELGAEVVKAELEDVASLEAAFRGANLIFSVTQYWEPFFRPDCRALAAEQGISCRRYAYDVELRQGKNIADAVAKAALDTLDDNGFLVSTLSNAKRCSNGRFTELYHFDAKAEVFPDYVNEKYPALAAKMSCIQTGYFMTSHRILPEAYFRKVCFILTYLPKIGIANTGHESSPMEVSRCAFRRLKTNSFLILMLMETLATLSTRCPRCHPVSTTCVLGRFWGFASISVCLERLLVHLLVIRR